VKNSINQNINEGFTRMVSSRLEMRGISLAFSGFQALSRVDFTLTGGSVHALTGANGAGNRR
jgi:simple sugar transport system ATP-binding protein